MSTTENKAIVRRLLEEGFGQGNLKLIDELVAADVADHGSLPGVPPGREGYRQTMQTYLETFHPAVRIDQQIAEGDFVVTRWTYSGKHAAPFMGIPASGTAVSGEVIFISRLDRGRVAEEWVQFDTLSLMSQIGAIPEMAAAAT